MKKPMKPIDKVEPPQDLKVFITVNKDDTTCDECGETLGRNAWIFLNGEKGANCLSCADLDHLVFLPSGDAALTRRSRKYSTLSAVVLKWSRARKQYERQGLLVEEAAIEQAEQECLADSDMRERRKERNAIKLKETDQAYVTQFSTRIKELYPHCPAGKETIIAQHACQKYSGRIGRSSQAKHFSEEAIKLAVIAHIRHNETPYDELLIRGLDRREARDQVSSLVNKVLARWAKPEPHP